MSVKKVATYSMLLTTLVGAIMFLVNLVIIVVGENNSRVPYIIGIVFAAAFVAYAIANLVMAVKKHSVTFFGKQMPIATCPVVTLVGLSFVEGLLTLLVGVFGHISFTSIYPIIIGIAAIVLYIVSAKAPKDSTKALVLKIVAIIVALIGYSNILLFAAIALALFFPKDEQLEF